LNVPFFKPIAFVSIGDRLLFEFCSGNLNPVPTLPKGHSAKFLAILGRVVFVMVPVKHWALCMHKFFRSFKTLRFPVNVSQIALSVGTADIYYGSAFESDSSTVLLRILPAKDIDFSLPNLDQALHPATVLKEAMLFHFRFYESVKTAWNELRDAERIKSVWEFWYQALDESGSGQLTSTILIDQAVKTLLSDFPQVQHVILPLEGRTWEKLVIRSCCGKAISIGYCHGAITGAHQGLLGRNMARLFSPDYVICSGQYFKQLLVKSEWPADQIFVTPYLRHRSIVAKDFSPCDPKIKVLVVMLTGNRFLSELLIDWLLGVDRNQVRLKVGLNKRAASYDYLSRHLEDYGLEEWDGELNDNVVILTRSVSALSTNVHAAFLSTGDQVDETVCSYFDEPLKRGMVTAGSESGNRCVEIYDAIRAIDLRGFEPSFYFERSDKAQIELVDIVTKIRGLSCERTIISRP
jgi:hypothetical protein